ncbi:MAG: hypothetical protein JSS62_02075 [Verrucomicrobia bacterium]|nr:hypothetical protein [Verrucomicrobiota bacterium]
MNILDTSRIVLEFGRLESFLYGYQQCLQLFSAQGVNAVFVETMEQAIRARNGLYRSLLNFAEITLVNLPVRNSKELSKFFQICKILRLAKIIFSIYKLYFAHQRFRSQYTQWQQSLPSPTPPSTVIVTDEPAAG